MNPSFEGRIVPARRSLARRLAVAASLAFGALALTHGSAHAVNRYYVGPDGGSWSNAANWSLTSGGAGGAGVPGVGDRAILDPGVTKSVTFDADYARPGLLQLYLDGQGGATVTLNQGAHTMVSAVASVGIQGNGVYHQFGGVDTTTGDIHIGQAGGGFGTYLLDDGALDVGASEYVGEGASVGTFTQAGGVHVVHDALKIAFSSGSVGHFNLSNGSVSASDPAGSGYLTIGYLGTGTFTQTGGSVSVSHLQLAQGSTGNATYDLQAGTLTVNGSEAIGEGGTAVFTQSGGTHTMTGNLYLTLDPGSSGTYNLNAGTLNVTGNIVNNGTMTQASPAFLNLGGTVIGNGIIHTNGAFAIANQTNINTGTVQVDAGTATAQTLIVGKDAANPDVPSATIAGDGTLDIRGGTITVDGVLGAGNDGTLTAGAGSGHIEVSGGTLNAKSTLLGSTAGGGGGMHVFSHGQVVIGGGLWGNGLIVDAGSIQVLDQPPPPGEDPMLDRSIVAGYLSDGAMHVHGGTVTSPKLKLGVSSGKSGTMDMDGGTVSIGTLGVGNDATLTAGTGTGSVTVSGGTLNAKSVLLGSTAGGVGSFRISGIGQVVIGGGLRWTDLTVDGGSLQVLDQAPPPGEDPVLDRSLVGGYLRDGTMTMNAGTASTPNLKIGVTPGKVGTFTMNGGSLAASNLLATNGAGSVIAFNGGTLRSGHSDVAKGSALVIGNGSAAARLGLEPAGGTHTFANGITLSANGLLTGAGTIVGSLTNSGTVSPGNLPGDIGIIAVTGSYVQTSGGALTMDLGAGAPGVGYDALRVTGAVALNGTLNVKFVPGNLPGVGQQMTVVTGHPVSGTFASVQGAGVAVSYTDTSVVATFTALDVPQPVDGSIRALALGPIEPNPLRAASRITFELPGDGRVSLSIHDASGRLVRTLAAGTFAAGRHSMLWDGRDASGAFARPGLYLVRLTALGTSLSRKAVVLP